MAEHRLLRADSGPNKTDIPCAFSLHPQNGHESSVFLTGSPRDPMCSCNIKCLENWDALCEAAQRLPLFVTVLRTRHTGAP